MPALTVAAKRSAGDLHLVKRHGDDLNLGLREEELEVGAPGIAFASFDHEGRFHPARRRDPPYGRVLDRADESKPLGLVQQDCDEGRGIQHHQRGTPYSS